MEIEWVKEERGDRNWRGYIEQKEKEIMWEVLGGYCVQGISE